MLVLFLAAGAAGCGADRYYTSGMTQVGQQQYDAGVANLARASRMKPDNVSYADALQQSRLAAAQWHLNQARGWVNQNNLAMAEAELLKSLEYNPSLADASVLLNNVRSARVQAAGEPAAPAETVQAGSLYDPTAAPAPALAGVQPAADARLSADQLAQLLGPVALYPDPLLAEVLPAAGYPDQVQQAAQWLGNNPTPSDAAMDDTAFEPPIKALLRYPQVLRQMADNPDWTQAVGAAFVNQPEEAMAAIQRLRQLALEQDSLQNTDQQQVIAEADAIEILPTDPNVVYVPEYDPLVVYVRSAPITRFWRGPRVGPWLANGCDWHRHWVVVGGDWHPGWQHDGHDWRPQAGRFQTVNAGRTSINVHGRKINDFTGMIVNVANPRPYRPSALRPRPTLPNVLRPVASGADRPGPIRTAKPGGWALPPPRVIAAKIDTRTAKPTAGPGKPSGFTIPGQPPGPVVDHGKGGSPADVRGDVKGASNRGRDSLNSAKPPLPPHSLPVGPSGTHAPTPTPTPIGSHVGPVTPPVHTGPVTPAPSKPFVPATPLPIAPVIHPGPIAPVIHPGPITPTPPVIHTPPPPPPVVHTPTPTPPVVHTPTPTPVVHTPPSPPPTTPVPSAGPASAFAGGGSAADTNAQSARGRKSVKH